MAELIETSYTHLKGDNEITVTAAERWSISMVNRLKEKYPEQVKIIHTNPDGSLLAHMPADWMRIVPKKRNTMTDEQRFAAAERMRAAKLAKASARD